MGQTVKNEIEQVKSKWGQAIVAADLQGVLNLYQSEALLKPTLSDRIREGIKEIAPYFEGSAETGDAGFLKQGITRVEFTYSFLKARELWCVEVGQYTFHKESGESVDGDYTFVFEKKQPNEEWKISSHHSSLTYRN